MIEFKNVTKQFGDGTVALDDVNFVISPGEYVFIVGPSGAGKTTILRLLIRDILPTSGSIFLDKEEVNVLHPRKIPHLRRKIGAAFQDYKLLRDRTVFENVALILDFLKKPAGVIKSEVSEILKLVGLKNKSDVFPGQLSGGELQRTVIARALAAKPDVLFADEPTGNLDPGTAWQIVKLLKKIQESGKTVIMATHNFDIVDSLKERVITLEKGKITSDKKKGKYK
jgi:cell division transport system ATP-binding protein